MTTAAYDIEVRTNLDAHPNADPWGYLHTIRLEPYEFTRLTLWLQGLEEAGEIEGFSLEPHKVEFYDWGFDSVTQGIRLQVLGEDA